MVLKIETNDKKLKDIKSLIAILVSKDGMARQKARHALIGMGSSVVPFLTEALTHSKAWVRWEAAKALIALRDPRSAPDLVKALTDKSFEVRWLAAEGLITLQRDALKPLFIALIGNPQNWDLRQGAHHVLHALEREGLLNEKCLLLLNALRNPEAEFSVPFAAESALLSLTRQDYGSS
jgi:HEAT repeat protein